MPETSNQRMLPLEFVIKTFGEEQTVVNQTVIEKIEDIFKTGGTSIKVVHKKQKPER